MKNPLECIDHTNSAPLTAKELREKIIQLEQEMMNTAHDGPESLQTNIIIAGGICTREILIPKDTLLTGKIHNFVHINIISQGDISVMTEDGIKRLKAPCTIVSKPGMKRVGYAHEDTVWTTIHATTETDINKLEETLVHNDYSKLIAIEEG